MEEAQQTAADAPLGFWRRAFLGPPRPADWLVPLGALLAHAVVTFVTLARSEAGYFHVLPRHVTEIGNVLALGTLAKLGSLAALAAVPAALALASRRCDVRRAALVTCGVLALATLLSAGWLVPLAQRHRDEVVTRIDAGTLRDAGFTTTHEPFPLNVRPEAWTLPQQLRAALTGQGPTSPLYRTERVGARLRVTDLALGLVGLALPFLACWAPRRLRFPWPLVLAATLFPVAISMAGWRLLQPWLQPALERGETSALSLSLRLAPPLVVGGGAWLAASRLGVPRCVAPGEPALSRRERGILATLVGSAALVVVAGTLTLGSAVGTTAQPAKEAGDALVGRPAPALAAAAWLGVDAPPATAGQPVLVDFWGTWCGPCVRSMPRVQQLHDELGPLGLRVLALTYEDAETVKPFLARNGYTLPVGCDTERTSVAAWKVKSWPTTYVVGRDGTVKWKGDPHRAEPVLLRELGLPSEPCAVLGQAASEDAARRRWALGWLAREAPASLDARDCEAAGPAAGKVRAWARGELRRSHPLDDAEAATLLARRAHSTLVEQLALRGAPDDVLATLVADAPLRENAAARKDELRHVAGEATLCERWVLGPRVARDQQALWNELALSGARRSCERSGPRPRTLSVALDGRELTAPLLRGHAHDRMAQALLCEDLAAGRSPSLADLDTRTSAELAAIARRAEEEYGWH